MEHKLLVSLERKKKRTARKLKDWLVKQREVLEERVAAPCFATTAVHRVAGRLPFRLAMRLGTLRTRPPHACLPSPPTLSVHSRTPQRGTIALTSARRGGACALADRSADA